MKVSIWYLLGLIFILLVWIGTFIKYSEYDIAFRTTAVILGMIIVFHYLGRYQKNPQEKKPIYNLYIIIGAFALFLIILILIITAILGHPVQGRSVIDAAIFFLPFALIPVVFMIYGIRMKLKN